MRLKVKVKIKNKIYDSNNEPIMLIFDSSHEKELLIDNLKQEGVRRKYCELPVNYNGNVGKFMIIDSV